MAGHHDQGPTEATAEELAAASHADLEYLVNPPGAEYEHTDASVWTIVKFGIWLAVSAVIIHIGLGLMYMLLQRQSTVQQQEQGQRYPLATATEPRLPPAPRLQQFPRTEMYELRLQQEQKLDTYGWVNKDAGTVHIPIDEAMKAVIQNGVVQSRPEDAATAPQPGLMPADSSSGRTMERRRQ